MELRALRCFVAVADCGTVTAGAEVLGVGQPAVSRQIRQLERRLGVDLFLREDGRLRLTSAGREVLEAARPVLDGADRITDTARAVAAGRLPQVRIVATGTTRDDVLAPWLATWGTDRPLASIDEASVDRIYPALRSGTADLAVSPAPPPAELASRAVAALPLWACVAPGHAWARRRSVRLTDLAEEDLLLLTGEFHARRRFDEALDREGLGVEPAATFASPVVAQAVAASGRGICVLTDDPRFGLVPLTIQDREGRPLRINLHAAWEPSHHAATLLAELADDLSAFTADRYAG